MVGPSRQVISLHSGVFESFTVPWVKTSDTSRGTTTDNPIVIEDAVEDIFVYVCQYLYTGDYSIPLPDDVVPYHIGEDEQHEQNNILMLKGSIFENSASVKKLADYTVRGIQPRPALPSNGHHYHHFWNYSRALLAHAQLNVFAGKSNLEELRDISLYKLLHTLHDFPFHDGRIGDIIKLVRFVFGSESGACRNLKGLTLHYMALHIKQLRQNKEFQLFLQELPSLSRLLLNTLCDFL